MRKYWKKGIVVGLGVIFLLKIAFSDVLSLEFTSYAKTNEEVFFNVEWDNVNNIYVNDEMILSGEAESDFEIDENGILTAYHGDGGDVVIPEGITEIGEKAFENCISLTSVIIPEGVTKIGWDAFSGCSNLTSVTIPEGLIEMEGAAFENCSSLTSITIPEGVAYIGDWTFGGCSSLTNVVLPKGIETGWHIFYGCKSLTSVILPEGITIGYYAFMDCSNLESVILPEGITEIGDGVFSDCISLTSVTIPEEVTTIGHGAFRNCSSLTNITIPEEVIKIGGAAFADCSNLTIYCYADSYAETYVKQNNIPYQLIETVENPSIITTDIPKAEQYMSYRVVIENNNQDNENEVSYSLKEGLLPNGMELKKKNVE